MRGLCSTTSQRRTRTLVARAPHIPSTHISLPSFCPSSRLCLSWFWLTSGRTVGISMFPTLLTTGGSSGGYGLSLIIIRLFASSLQWSRKLAGISAAEIPSRRGQISQRVNTCWGSNGDQERPHLPHPDWCLSSTRRSSLSFGLCSTYKERIYKREIPSNRKNNFEWFSINSH